MPTPAEFSQPSCQAAWQCLTHALTKALSLGDEFRASHAPGIPSAWRSATSCTTLAKHDSDDKNITRSRPGSRMQSRHATDNSASQDGGLVTGGGPWPPASQSGGSGMGLSPGWCTGYWCLRAHSARIKMSRIGSKELREAQHALGWLMETKTTAFGAQRPAHRLRAHRSKLWLPLLRVIQLKIDSCSARC